MRQRICIILLCLFVCAHCFGEGLQTDSLCMHCTYTWQLPYQEIQPLTLHDLNPIEYHRTDRGIFGGEAGNSRIYCDITFPTLTSECLVDVGMALSGMIAPLSLAPRWFSMFSPTACPVDELFGSAKCQTAIMLTMRTYF